jgi:hypothetical protein
VTEGFGEMFFPSSEIRHKGTINKLSALHGENGSYLLYLRSSFNLMPLLTHKKEVLMKKFICLFFAVISWISFAVGQWQPQMNKLLPERSRDHTAGQMPSHFSKNYNLPFHSKESDLNNPNMAKWRWDSIFTFDLYGGLGRYSRTFDANGNSLTELEQEWQISTWVDQSRYTYTYDANGNTLTGLHELWETNAWLNESKITLSWDANGNMLTFMQENWQSGAWVNSSKYTYVYDANGNLLTELLEVWFASAWENYARYTYTYDANGNVLTALSELWQTNAWENWSRSTLTYDAIGNQLTELVEDWQITEWVNYIKFTYTYDAGGNRLSQLSEEWQTNAWVNSWRYAYTYDADGNMLTETNETWVVSEWVYSMKYTYTYDADGNRLTLLSEMWQSPAWVSDLRQTYTYDSNGNSLTGKVEFWQNNNWEPGSGILYIFSQKSFAYFLIDVYRFEASFASFATGVAENIPDNSSLAVYPNPATETITVKRSGPANNMSGSVCIYDITGKELIRQEVNGSVMEINVSSLPDGLFFIRLMGKEGIGSGKFVKE